MTKQAIGYCRVSTQGQAVDGVSLDAQESKIRSWAIANDYKLVNVFVDAGLSGGRADNRPQLQSALAAVCKNKAALIVYSLSRLSRSVKDMLSISERLDRSGADLVSLSERVDTTSAAGRMVFKMLSVLNEFERDQLGERTRMALAYKKSNGERISGQLPFGCRLADDGVHLIEDDEEQRIIRIILGLRSQGMSYRNITVYLTANNIKSPRGGKWFISTVYSIVQRAEKVA